MVTKCHITKRSHETTKRHRTEKRLANAWWWSLLNRPARPLDVRDGAFPAKPHTHHAVSSLTFCSDRAFLSLLQKEEKKKTKLSLEYVSTTLSKEPFTVHATWPRPPQRQQQSVRTTAAYLSERPPHTRNSQVSTSGGSTFETRQLLRGNPTYFLNPPCEITTVTDSSRNQGRGLLRSLFLPRDSFLGVLITSCRYRIG